MSWDIGLDGPAFEIAGTDKDRLRVVAGPGTGKSFAMMRRVARLLEQGQEPKRIMGVTFTRNAAASLVADVGGLDVPGSEEVRVGTLHSYCFSLLNRADVFSYLNRKPRPLIMISKAGSLLFEGKVLLDDLVFSSDFGKRDCTQRIRAFEAAWARLQSEQPGWPQDEDDKEFQSKLIDWLKFHKSMLIGELIPEALRFLRNNPAHSALTDFDHVIVDEYQDLNRAEQEIIDLLSKRGKAAIVGDADQSIYSFRYAHPDGIEDYSSRHHDTHDVSLTECRRCPTSVVSIADHLIKFNHPVSSTPRLEKKADNTNGEIHIIQWQDTENEAEGIMRYVRYLTKERGYAPSDILIITPRRRLAYRLRDVIQGNCISVHSFYQEEALEEIPAQQAFSLLTLLNDPEDRVALRWWLGHKSSSGLSASYHKLRQYCEDSGDSPKSVLEAIDSGELKLNGTSYLVRRFRELKAMLAELSELNLKELVDQILPENDPACAALRDIAVPTLDQFEKVPELFDYIRTHITQPEVPEGDFVRIMSPQKSKGLTSKVVIVTSCVEGLLPVLDSNLSLNEQEEAIREQRRLFYVAITRCTDILVLSSFTSIEYSLAWNIGAQIRNSRGPVGQTITSRFIGELGPDAPNPQVGDDWV